MIGTLMAGLIFTIAGISLFFWTHFYGRYCLIGLFLVGGLSLLIGFIIMLKNNLKFGDF